MHVGADLRGSLPKPGAGDRADQAVRPADDAIAVEGPTGRRVDPGDGAEIGRGVVGPVRTEDQVGVRAQREHAVAADLLVSRGADDAVGGRHHPRDGGAAIAQIADGTRATFPVGTLQYRRAVAADAFDAVAADAIVRGATDQAVRRGERGIEGALGVVGHGATGAVPVRTQHHALLVAARAIGGEAAGSDAIAGIGAYEAVGRADHTRTAARVDEPDRAAIAVPTGGPDHGDVAARVGEETALVGNAVTGRQRPVAGRRPDDAVGGADGAEGVAAGAEDGAVGRDEGDCAAAAVPARAGHHDGVVDRIDVIADAGTDQTIGGADDAGHRRGAVAEPGQRAVAAIEIGGVQQEARTATHEDLANVVLNMADSFVGRIADEAVDAGKRAESGIVGNALARSRTE